MSFFTHYQCPCGNATAVEIGPPPHPLVTAARCRSCAKPLTIVSEAGVGTHPMVSRQQRFWWFLCRIGRRMIGRYP